MANSGMRVGGLRRWMLAFYAGLIGAFRIAGVDWTAWRGE
jgi:hypothetical protein